MRLIGRDDSELAMFSEGILDTGNININEPIARE